MQELSGLLHTATESVIIEWRLKRNNPGPIGIRWYRAALRELRTAFSHELLYTKELYEPRIQDQAVAMELFEFLRTELAEFISREDGQLVVISGPSGDLSLDELLTKLLSVALVDGSDKAAADFGRRVLSNRATAHRLSLLGGVSVAESLDINDRMRLVRVGNQVRDIPRFVYENFFESSPSLFHDLLTPEYFLGRAVLMVDFTYGPIFSNQLDDLNSDTVRQNIALAETNAAKFLEALSLVCGLAIGSVVRWTYLDNDSIFCRTGRGAAYDFESDSAPRVEVSPAQLIRAVEEYEKEVSGPF